MNKYDLTLILIQLVIAIFLYFVSEIFEKRPSSKWKILWIVPFILCIVFISLADFEISMIGAYVGSLIFFLGFFKENVKDRKVSSIISVFCTILSLIVCNIYNGYRSVNFVNDFENVFNTMKEHYVLSEHKNIDWDKLYNEYMPKFEEAYKNHDEVENAMLLVAYCSEFNDGHVAYSCSDNKVIDEVNKRYGGNDYGLSVMRLSSGNFVAVNVEEDSKVSENGIHNGTIITLWNGKSPEEVIKDSQLKDMMSYADINNKQFYEPLILAGIGGDTVDITFIDDNGMEKVVAAEKMGYYFDRYEETLNIINQGIECANLDWKELDKDTVALRIKSMMFDIESYNSGNHSKMKYEIKEKVAEYKSKGYENLIIDMRSNTGGSGQMVKALAELFSPEGEHYYCTDGIFDETTGKYIKDSGTGKYTKGIDNFYIGENIWNNPIIILVNGYSISAADHLTMLMQGFENITIMGFTEPNGSAQGVSMVYLETGVVSFSGSLMLNENSDIFVDSGTDYESGNDIDIRILFDEKVITELFDNGNDYILDYAVNYTNE